VSKTFCKSVLKAQGLFEPLKARESRAKALGVPHERSVEI